MHVEREFIENPRTVWTKDLIHHTYLSLERDWLLSRLRPATNVKCFFRIWDKNNIYLRVTTQSDDFTKKSFNVTLSNLIYILSKYVVVRWTIIYIYYCTSNSLDLSISSVCKLMKILKRYLWKIDEKKIQTRLLFNFLDYSAISWSFQETLSKPWKFRSFLRFRDVS